MAFQILPHVHIFLGLEAYNMSLLTGTSVPIVDVLDPVLFLLFINFLYLHTYVYHYFSFS